MSSPSNAKEGEAEDSIPLTGLEPEEFLRKIREQLKGRLGEDRENLTFTFGSFDIYQNIREIRALIKINDEIFARCMLNATKQGVETTLTRFGLEKVKTRQDNTKLELVAQPERVNKTFNTLPFAKLPVSLEDTLVIKYKYGCVDYEDLVRKALMLLSNDALKLFLPKLKDHLEAAQVCLGEMDEWAMQVNSNASFIEETFGKEFEIPVDIDPQSKSNECCHCNGRLSLYEGYRDCTFKKCKTIHTLTECTVSGKYDTVFDLSQESERARLKRFMFFVWG